MLGFGEVLKRMRGQHNISQRELGERIGLDFTYISKIENEAMPAPSEEKLILMAQIFGVNEYDFILMAGRVPTDFEIAIKSDKEVQELLKEKVKMYPKPHLKESKAK